MIELTNPFDDEGGVIRLLEVADSNQHELIEQVLNGTYDKPFVIEADGNRSLYFSRKLTQSGMSLSAPNALEFAYTRQMMSFLLFVHHPKRILMFGLGGGSMAKYCYQYLLSTAITVVEIDPSIIAFRDQFLLPPDGERLNIVLGDAADYVQHQIQIADVVVMDAFDRNGFSASVSTRGFYRDVRDALVPQGLLVANLVGTRAVRANHLEVIAEVFDANIICVPVENDGNYLVFAFKDASFEPRWRWIESQTKAMQTRYGLDFPKFAAEVKRYRKDGYLQRTLYANEGE
jgi:spermidine synthase